ncbi:MAG: anti-sigma factor [Planctomycetota bacterium]
MSDPSKQNTSGERFNRPEHELLAGYALGDLTESEHETATALLQEEPHRRVFEELERTAAAAQIALRHRVVDPLPANIADVIRRGGLERMSARSAGQGAVTAIVDFARTAVSPPETESQAEVSADFATADFDRAITNLAAARRREWLGWMVAAAAALLAIVMWQRPIQPPEIDGPSLTQRRNELLAKPNVVLASWSAGTTPLPESVDGEVVFDPETQSGFMTFRGLPINSPTKEQYQLWIIDPERDDEPVDGGVFDISSTGETIVEIDAKLKVIDPAAFAITIEKPGGVVVSTQERLPLLAKVGG